ncbi:exodeoxyribonuclease VII large subunit [Falsigemmobacter faecalis]|uniref:Exodeoxyribonuclease 7 large subunit n=1 Tax=Falsigemmobacter faecalis TaxID=2488730 RepID=A0A3P3DI99_9RHOB|nr:exodeoxyribonuclease VII large subunit [Falsigemmobacter faecalis]RRH73925.1 exodeoxyribonuclease VII large subunit [Falsigemmobacter faecalis]
MIDLFEEEPPRGNAPELSVSELSGAVKRVLEGEFARVRVRGEVGRVSRPSSGHLYFDLKDANAVLAAVSWKGQVAKMQMRPEEGMEIIATGRLTTFPGQSKYQLIVDDVAPAGLGALMMMLEKRKKALAAEGLFDPARKKPTPALPGVIGVVTSLSGAVIRDILHRLRDRFPRHVLIWPVVVQGEKCAPEVAAAIRGFNALQPGGPVPRPDLIIVARGGGSLEDLWGFNEEVVVRAAAASEIPLISAVGHETDTTLIDYAADRRAPTPTAAAEMAVPVRFELMSHLDTMGARLSRGVTLALSQRRQRALDLARALPRPEGLVQPARQRFDLWADRLPQALSLGVARRRSRLAELAASVRPMALVRLTATARERLAERDHRLSGALTRRSGEARLRLSTLSERLAPALERLLADEARRTVEAQSRLTALSARLEAAPLRQIARLTEQLEARDRLRQTLGHRETLLRGYAVVRGEDGHVVTSRAAAEKAGALDLEFADGHISAGAKAAAPKRSPKSPPPDQGSLF